MERHTEDVESLDLEVHADGSFIIVIEQPVAEPAQNERQYKARITPRVTVGSSSLLSCCLRT